MFTLAHEVPSRLRLVNSIIKTNSERGAALRQQLLACPGVTDVLVRPASGSVIVFHDGSPESRNGVLRALGLPVTPYPGQDANLPLLDAIIETTITRLVAHAAQAMVTAVL